MYPTHPSTTQCYPQPNYFAKHKIHMWKSYDVVQHKISKMPSHYYETIIGKRLIYANSTKKLVGSWLFCIQKYLCLVCVWYMVRDNVEIWTKSSLYSSNEGQTHFNIFLTSQKRSLALNDPNMVCSLFKLPHWLKLCTKHLPKIEYIACKTTNSQPKHPLDWRQL